MNEQVVITDFSDQVVIENSGSPRIGYPLRITISTPSFSGSVEAEALNVEGFINELSELHKTLRGEARLRFLGEDHKVMFRCDELGKLFVYRNYRRYSKALFINSGYV